MNLTGSMCAIATPFKAVGEMDLDAFGRLIDYQIAGGTQVLVVAGSTGEAHFLAQAEYTQLLGFAVQTTKTSTGHGRPCVTPNTRAFTSSSPRRRFT